MFSGLESKTRVHGRDEAGDHCHWLSRITRASKYTSDSTGDSSVKVASGKMKASSRCMPRASMEDACHTHMTTKCWVPISYWGERSPSTGIPILDWRCASARVSGLYFFFLSSTDTYRYSNLLPGRPQLLNLGRRLPTFQRLTSPFTSGDHSCSPSSSLLQTWPFLRTAFEKCFSPKGPTGGQANQI